MVCELEVTERFQSKNLPVEIQIGRRPEKSAPKHNSPGHVEKIWSRRKIIWHVNRRSDFEEMNEKNSF